MKAFNNFIVEIPKDLYFEIYGKVHFYKEWFPNFKTRKVRSKHIASLFGNDYRFKIKTEEQFSKN